MDRDSFVNSANIAKFGALLQAEQDDAKRQVLLKLLAEAQAKASANAEGNTAR